MVSRVLENGILLWLNLSVVVIGVFVAVSLFWVVPNDDDDEPSFFGLGFVIVASVIIISVVFVVMLAVGSSFGSVSFSGDDAVEQDVEGVDGMMMVRGMVEEVPFIVLILFVTRVWGVFLIVFVLSPLAWMDRLLIFGSRARKK